MKKCAGSAPPRGSKHDPRGKTHFSSAPLSDAYNRSTVDESIMFMKEDINTIIASIKSCSLNDLENIKRIKSLLETLSSFLVSNKCNHFLKYSINFIEQIKLLDNHLLKDVNAQTNDKERIHILLLYQVQNLALKNVRNLLKITNDLKSDFYSDLFEHFVKYLIDIRVAISQNDSEKNPDLAIQLDSIALALLKCLFFVAAKCEFNIDEIHKTNLCGKFIGILRCFSFYGLENYELNKLPVLLYPSPISQFFGKETTDSTPKKRRGKLDENDLLEDDTLFNTSSISFSTSEYSSSELEDSMRDVLSRREAQHNKKIYAKMRMLSYESLQCSLSIFGIRIAFGFWSFLFPDEPNLAENTQLSVLYTIVKDPSNRVRTSALNFMFNFFNFGKHFVRTLVSESSQEKKTSSKAFTPLSVALTSMVKELHSFFGHILLKESNSAILILIYKVISLIVSITPYNKLFTDIMHPLFYRNSFLLDHKVTQIKNLSLVLYEKMFTSETLSSKFHSWLIKDKLGREALDKLFSHCLEFSANPELILLCIESIKVLTCILKHHELMLDLLNCQSGSFDLEALSKMSIDTLQSDRSLTNPVLQSLICKFIHSLGVLFKYISNKIASNFKSDSEKLNFIKNWFLQVFSSKLFCLALVEGDMSVVQSSTQVTLINVISFIPEEVFILVDSNTHFRLISILMALAKEEIQENAIAPIDQDDTNSPIYCKSVAIRCLSIIQGFDCFSDDISLTFDLIDICLDVLAPNTGRTKSQKKKEIFLLEHSLWALANICDGIKKNHLETEFSYSLLKRIVVCLKSCYSLRHIQYQTHDILVNLVRCSGIVIYISLYKQSQTNLKTSDLEIVESLSESSSQLEPTTIMEIVEHLLDLLITKRLFKLQWNICIALSYLMSLDIFVELAQAAFKQSSSLTGSTMLDCIYDALFQSYTSTPNHKVESYSIYTICSVPKLDYFRTQLVVLWPCVVDKFIANFNIVPIHSRHSWLEKYVFTFEKLFAYFEYNHEHEQLKNEEHFRKLVEFVDSEMSSQCKNEAQMEQIEKLNSLLKD